MAYIRAEERTQQREGDEEGEEGEEAVVTTTLGEVVTRVLENMKSSGVRGMERQALAIVQDVAQRAASNTHLALRLTGTHPSTHTIEAL